MLQGAPCTLHVWCLGPVHVSSLMAFCLSLGSAGGFRESVEPLMSCQMTYRYAGALNCQTLKLRRRRLLLASYRRRWAKGALRHLGKEFRVYPKLGPTIYVRKKFRGSGLGFEFGVLAAGFWDVLGISSGVGFWIQFFPAVS